MPGDFDGCRFDFRIDSKKGLMPAKRKLRNTDRRGVSVGTTGGGTGCSTLYSCKQCGLLLDSRQSLVEHKLSHRNITKPTSGTPDTTSTMTYIFEGDPDQGTCSSMSWSTSPNLGHASNENLTPVDPLQRHISPGLLQRSSASSERQSLIQRYITGLSRARSRDDYDVIEPRDAIRQPSSSLKGRQLDKTVERLWMSKLKSTASMESTVGDGDTVMQCGRVEDKTPEAEVKHGDELQRLFVRRVTAAPGTQPLFYTSLMRLQSSQKKEKRQVCPYTVHC